MFMGCETKNAKVVAISLGSLQRLIALKAVPQSAVPVIVNTMTDCMNQGVDIQLRILQTLLSLITNFPAVHGDLLGDVRVLFLLRFALPLRRLTLFGRRYCYVSSCRNRELRSCLRRLLQRSGSWSCLWWTRLWMRIGETTCRSRS